MEDTETVFWSNLEGGLCLLAVNLPSLWAIFGTVSSPASQLVASIRSALSLRSLGIGSNHSSSSKSRGAIGGEGAVHGAIGYADDSQVRIHETVKVQSGEWHRLGEIESRETGADAPRLSDGTEIDATNHDSMV